MNWKIIPAGIVLTLALAACGGNGLTPLEASGFIEADEISVVAETSGRVAAVLVSEGEEVAEGEVLVRLDDSLLQSRRAEAQAAVDEALARRDEQIDGPREERVSLVKARSLPWRRPNPPSKRRARFTPNWRRSAGRCRLPPRR